MPPDINRIMKALTRLAQNWPDGLTLWADNGCLELVNDDTGEIIAEYPGITCDGGDPDHRSVDNKDFIILD